jgi:uncharacterized membrane protein YoaK (UPF0700 family)
MLESPTPDRKATVLLLLMIAGCVDAVGVAELGRYFVSFMSGNTTLMGIALADRDWSTTLLLGGLIALFVGGATVGTLLVEQARDRATGVLLLVEAGLLGLAYVGLGSSRPLAGIVPLPVAMGLANIVTLRSGSPHPGTTYATGALIRLGIALAGLGRGARAGDAGFHAAMWLMLLIGGAAGAYGRLRCGDAILLAPVVALVVLGVFDLLSRRHVLPHDPRPPA